MATIFLSKIGFSIWAWAEVYDLQECTVLLTNLFLYFNSSDSKNTNTAGNDCCAEASRIARKRSTIS